MTAHQPANCPTMSCPTTKLKNRLENPTDTERNFQQSKPKQAFPGTFRRSTRRAFPSNLLRSGPPILVRCVNERDKERFAIPKEKRSRDFELSETASRSNFEKRVNNDQIARVRVTEPVQVSRDGFVTDRRNAKNTRIGNLKQLSTSSSGPTTFKTGKTFEHD